MPLEPDVVVTKQVGAVPIAINQKVIPDSMRAIKDVCSYVKKGQPLKPCRPFRCGRPLGITIHNTPAISAIGGDMAEAYTRATRNGNMNGVAVHFYVSEKSIWQNLYLNEQGWHAKDGTRTRRGHRWYRKLGGNVDTIAIECVGSSPSSEETTAKLAAWLCKYYKLDPFKDIYTHNYWMYGVDKVVAGAPKNCPVYILPHWQRFLGKVKWYVGRMAG